MGAVPTMRVKNGERVAIINVSDAEAWAARGWHTETDGAKTSEGDKTPSAAGADGKAKQKSK